MSSSLSFQRLVGQIDQIGLQQQPEAVRFDTVTDRKDLDAVDRPVVVTIVDQDALLDQNLLARIAGVQDIERVVRPYAGQSERTEGAEIRVAGLPVQHEDAEFDSAVVLDPVVQQREIGGRQDQRNVVGSAVRNFHLLDGRRTVDGQDGRTSPCTVKNVPRFLG